MSTTEPCPWCGIPCPMHGYRTPAEHPCDFSRVCGAPTPIPAYQQGSALAGRCRNPRSQSDGRCYAHSSDPAAVERRRLNPPGPKGRLSARWSALSVVVLGDDLETLQRAADAAGVSCTAMVSLLIRNHLGGSR